MTINAEDFKQALQRWASGVTIVTTHSPTHGLLGMTATSFASVSMDPPQILVCINDAAITASGIAETGHFAVNILAEGYEKTSNLFAGGASEADRFASVAWHQGNNGTPLLDESLTTLECKVSNQVRAGTHWVIIGIVTHVIFREGKPLLYFKAGYKQLNSEEN